MSRPAAAAGNQRPAESGRSNPTEQDTTAQPRRLSAEVATPTANPPQLHGVRGLPMGPVTSPQQLCNTSLLPGAVGRGADAWHLAGQQRMARGTASRALLRTPSPPNTEGHPLRQTLHEGQGSPSSELCSPCRQLPRWKLKPGCPALPSTARLWSSRTPQKSGQFPLSAPISELHVTEKHTGQGSSSLSWCNGGTACYRPPWGPTTPLASDHCVYRAGCSCWAPWAHTCRRMLLAMGRV